MHPTLLHESIPEGTAPLYHYTSQTGVIGMINHKHLWFTHIHYLNDSSEYNEAAKLIEKVLKEEYNIDFDDRLKYEHARLYGEVYSFSLSEEENLLSQWRGYCPNGGYSVSFQNSLLNEMMQANNLYIGRCIYDEEEQKEIIRRYIVKYTPEEYKDRFINLPEEPEPKGNSLSEIGANKAIFQSQLYRYMDSRSRDLHEYKPKIYENAIKYAPLFKNKHFKEEKEWRMIAVSKHRPELREGKSFMIPYLRIPLVKDIVNDHVQGPKIIVGPTANPELAVRACKLLKTKAIVSVSDIPFRNW